LKIALDQQAISSNFIKKNDDKQKKSKQSKDYKTVKTDIDSNIVEMKTILKNYDDLIKDLIYTNEKFESDYEEEFKTKISEIKLMYQRIDCNLSSLTNSQQEDLQNLQQELEQETLDLINENKLEYDIKIQDLRENRNKNDADLRLEAEANMMELGACFTDNEFEIKQQKKFLMNENN
ncbi:MAG: hypothetical protein MHPSP_003678, partial [Paramarteilia canceri]